MVLIFPCPCVLVFCLLFLNSFQFCNSPENLSLYVQIISRFDIFVIHKFHEVRIAYQLLDLITIKHICFNFSLLIPSMFQHTYAKEILSLRISRMNCFINPSLMCRGCIMILFRPTKSSRVIFLCPTTIFSIKGHSRNPIIILSLLSQWHKQQRFFCSYLANKGES